MKKLIAFPALITSLFFSGCGLVGLLGTETSYEKKVPAEYNLYKLKGKKILVLVEQPGWLDTQTNLRYYLTKAMGNSLEAKVKIEPESIISYDEIAEFRSKIGDFSLLSPVEAGKALGVNLVLVVAVQDCQVNQLSDTEFYNGHLSVNSALFDTETGKKVWPMEAEGKNVKVGFEVGENGQEAAVNRLVSVCAYCTTRYFYNCPKIKFKAFDERSGEGWTGWE